MKMSLDGNSNSSSVCHNPQTVLEVSKSPTTISRSTEPLTSILTTSIKNIRSHATISKDLDLPTDVEITTLHNQNVDKNSKIISSSLELKQNNEKKTVSFRDETDMIEHKLTASDLHRNKYDKYSATMHPSITDRLPQNTYYCDPPNLYIFPGAEIWWNDSDDDESSYDEDDDDNDDDDNEEDNEVDDEPDNEDIDSEAEHKIVDNELIKNIITSAKQVNIDDEMARDARPSEDELLHAKNKDHQQKIECYKINNDTNSNDSINVNEPVNILTRSSVEMKSIMRSTIHNKRRSSCATSNDGFTFTETANLAEHALPVSATCYKKRKLWEHTENDNTLMENSTAPVDVAQI